MKKGQLSTELLFLIGGLVIISLVLFYYAAKQISETHKIAKAEDAVSHLVEKVNELASLNTGTKDSIWIDIPSKVLEVRLSGKYISLVLLLGNGEQYIMTKETLTTVVGTVNFSMGLQQLYATKINETTIKIGTEPMLLEIVPPCVSESDATNNPPLVTVLGADLTPNSVPFALGSPLLEYSYETVATLFIPSESIYLTIGTSPAEISVSTPPNLQSNSLCFHIYPDAESCSCLGGEEGSSGDDS
ncbi:MAG: hypothetical protein Q8L34_03580 [Candidatus Woesearchaeota archaeon]|nr:hypothetical protein [Candidatus Woesearchaeota archaeon]